MKKTAPVVLCICILLFACSKKKKDTLSSMPYYLKYRENGVPVNNTGNNYIILRPHSGFAGYTELQISSNTNDNKDNLSIVILKQGNIGIGAYNSLSGYDMYADYFKNAGQPTQIDYSTITTVTTPAPFAVFLTEITDTYIKGKFTGPYLYTDNKSDSMRITDGDFFLKRHK